MSVGRNDMGCLDEAECMQHSFSAIFMLQHQT
jgi:hypothetical protein